MKPLLALLLTAAVSTSALAATDPRTVPTQLPQAWQTKTRDLFKQAIEIPTIGIGSGKDCDGQILVTHDLIGFFPWFTPKFVAPEAKVAEQIRQAARRFVDRVRGQ